MLKENRSFCVLKQILDNREISTKYNFRNIEGSVFYMVTRIVIYISVSRRGFSGGFKILIPSIEVSYDDYKLFFYPLTQSVLSV